MRDVIAKKSIKKGEIFGEDNIGVMPRDISGSYDKNYFTSTQEVYDKEAKTYIPKSYIVVSWMVKEKSLVTKRAKVRIKAIAGDVEVSADGEILEDGARGAKVKVKNLASNKVVIGTVVSSGEVLVEIL